MKHAYLTTLVLALALAGCGDDDTTPDAATQDMTIGSETGGGDTIVTECPEMGAPEDSAAACMDGCDNDKDGQTDCDDFGCTAFCSPECATEGPEDTEAACTDGCDNDRNGFFDCNENRCKGTLACPVEKSNAQCSDGIDNDGNGFIDCMDFGCSGGDDPADGVGVCTREQSNAACSDGVDNNNQDGIDCADPRCQAEGIIVCDGATPVNPLPPKAMWAQLTNAICTDGMDNDENNFTDCADFGCLNNFDASECHDLPSEGGNLFCNDGIDNDKDGTIDCDDFGCVTDDGPREGIVVCNAAREKVEFADNAAITAAVDAICDDGTDNDGNNFSDCMDFGCQGPLQTICPTEADDITCADGMDNDGDDFTDCMDFSCKVATVSVCESETTVAQCSDGMDNDGNGFADCFDRACKPVDDPDGRRTSPACK